jgi:hypothetical protein
MKMQLMKKIILAFLVTTVFTVSCSKRTDAVVAPPGTCSPAIRFSTNVKSIFDVNCSRCHGSASINTGALAKWMYDGTYASVYAERNRINAQTSAGLMPQGRPLAQVIRDSISCWVANGAPD